MVIIEGASKGYSNIAGRFLQNKVVLYLAKISYGIYLYHIFAAFIFSELFKKARLPIQGRWHYDINNTAPILVITWVVFVFILYFLLLLHLLPGI